jgi:hypothetical protein
MSQSMTKTYQSEREFSDDVSRMMTDGWTYRADLVRRVPKDTQVITYNNPTDFNNDVSNRNNNGWTVVSTTEKTRNPGCLGVILTLGLRLIFKPKPQVVVTYQRSEIVVPYTRAQ